MKHLTCSLVISRRDIYLRSYAAISVVRTGAVQSVTATIIFGAEWHGITTVDWFSVRLSLCSDGKYHRLWAWGPSWGGHDRTCTWAGCPGAVRCRAVHPIRGVATRSVGRPQGHSVSTFNDGISVICQSENRIMRNYFKSKTNLQVFSFHNYPDTIRKFVTLRWMRHCTRLCRIGFTSSWS